MRARHQVPITTPVPKMNFLNHNIKVVMITHMNHYDDVLSGEVARPGEKELGEEGCISV